MYIHVCASMLHEPQNYFTNVLLSSLLGKNGITKMYSIYGIHFCDSLHTKIEIATIRSGFHQQLDRLHSAVTSDSRKRTNMHERMHTHIYTPRHFSCETWPDK